MEERDGSLARAVDRYLWSVSVKPMFRESLFVHVARSFASVVDSSQLKILGRVISGIQVAFVSCARIAPLSWFLCLSVPSDCVYQVPKRNHYARKQTGFASNLPRIELLGRKCPGLCDTHRHETCWGSRKVNGKRVVLSKAAGHYPEALCLQLAHLVRDCVWPEHVRHGTVC